jgi:hypothetical protein
MLFCVEWDRKTATNGEEVRIWMEMVLSLLQEFAWELRKPMMTCGQNLQRFEAGASQI